MSKIYLCSILCLINLSAWTQTSSLPDSTRTLEEVVITASKVPLSQRESAKPVTIITPQEIERSAGKDLAQLLQEQTGIIVNAAYSNPGKDKGVFVRGAASQYTLILLNGQPVSDPSGVGGTFDIRLIPLQLIDRIEIVKGSQSTLYGTDAIAGVINIITKQDADNSLSVYGDAAIASLNGSQGSLGVRGDMGKFDYQVQYQRTYSEGITEALDQVDTVDFDKDGIERQTVFANFGFEPLKSLQIRPFIRYTDFDGEFDADAFTDAANTYDAEWINPGITVDYQVNKVSIQTAYHYTHTDRNFSTTFGESQFKGRFHNADIFASYALSPHISWVAGINYQYQQLLDSTYNTPDPSIEIVSPYTTLLLRSLKGLSLELGYRLNNHTNFGNHSVYTASGKYAISPESYIFANYSTGFKAPTLFELYGPFGGNVELEPQTSSSWEIGAYTQLLDDKINAQITYFDRSIEDVIVFAFGPGYFNQDQQADHGVEAELSVKLHDLVTISGNYTYIDGEVTTVNDLEQDTSFFNLIRRPKHSGNLSLQTQPTDRLFVSLDLQIVGDRTDNFFNPANNFAAEEVLLSAYTLLNIYAEYQLIPNKLTLYTDIKNLTDTNFTEIYGFSTLGTFVQTGIRFDL